jgi:hypothetical protein
MYGACKSEVNMGEKFAGMKIILYLCIAFENQVHRRSDGAGRKPTKHTRPILTLWQ